MDFKERVKKLKATYPQRQEWWSRVFASPMAHLFLCVVGDLKVLTPNRLTSLSFILILVSATLIFIGTTKNLVIAAFVIQLAYIFDCMDGQLARYRGVSTLFGSFLDKSLDFIKFPILIFALMWESYHRLQSIKVIIYAFLCLFFMSFFFYIKSMIKAEYNIAEWQILSGQGFIERNLRFFLFEESQWYLIVTVTLLLGRGELSLLIISLALGVICIMQIDRTINILLKNDKG